MTATAWVDMIPIRISARGLDVYILALFVLPNELRLTRLRSTRHGRAKVLVALVSFLFFLSAALAGTFALFVCGGSQFVFHFAAEFA